MFVDKENATVSGNNLWYALFAVAANEALEGTDLLDRAISWLARSLPSTWSVRRTSRSYGGGNLPEPRAIDGAIDLEAGNHVSATILVEARRSFSPRDVGMFDEPLARSLRTLSFNAPILVVSEWLSPRTRELLEEQGVNYLDLTGNALLRLEDPALFIRSAGAARAPRAVSRGSVRLRGPKAARVLRLLVDVRPPAGVREIASSCSVAASYVSRLLDALDREALIERSGRGRVESVDVPRLLRRWAEVYDVLEPGRTATYVAPRGVKQALGQIRGLAPELGRVAITGSVAASRLAPVAAPALLVAYCDDLEAVARALGLLPATAGGDVALLRPYDSVVWERCSVEDGLRYVAPSQAAVDCLTGNGRMPAEGEALIDWMIENEASWRLPSLRGATRVGPGS